MAGNDNGIFCWQEPYETPTVSNMPSNRWALAPGGQSEKQGPLKEHIVCEIQSNSQIEQLRSSAGQATEPPASGNNTEFFLEQAQPGLQYGIQPIRI